MLTSDGKIHYVLHFTFGGVVSFLIYRLDSCARFFSSGTSAKEGVPS